ncbi:MAG: hypothetical protein WC780_12390 [Lentimicrobiaceae bacterium]
MTKMMNLAILLDNEEIFLWEYQVLDELLNSGLANFNVIIKNDKKSNDVRHNHYSLFYIFHEKLDRYLYKKEFDFDKKVNITNRLSTTPLINLTIETLVEGQINTNINNIHNYDLDFIINFGKAPVKKELANACKYGILTYNIGNYSNYDITPSCYWEVVNNMFEIEVVIRLFNKEYEKEIEIFRTGILPHSNSINLSRNSSYKLASLLIPRIISGIHLNGNAYIEELKRNFNYDEELSGFTGYKAPSSVKAFSNLISVFNRFIAYRFWYHYTGYWSLIYKLNDKNELFPSNPGTFKTLKAPKGTFWADPFVISRDKHHYIFVEEYIYKTGKGHISVLKLDEKGVLLNCERILEKLYHLSYPHIFEHGGEYYMIPETGSNKTIELYKCTSFPNKWVFVRNIMENISSRDTTVFYYNNKWWLFTSIIELTTTTLSFNELFLYYSNDLFSSDWISHPENPIVSDHKVSRPAGKIFIKDNKIYRPSQDCSGIYGKALNINQIIKLTENEYEEIPVKKIEPNWNKKVKGTHTYNSNDKITVMDVFTERKRINSRN